MRITEEEFDQELYYQTVMHFVRIILLKDMISENEFFQVEIMNRERYKPLMGVLLSGKYLAQSSRHVNNFISQKDKKHHRDVLRYGSS